MPRKPDIEELRKDKDLEGLMDALRYPGSALIRAQAAQALGQLNDSLAVESLIRSMRLDPAAEVQVMARQALEEMFGANAQNVIQAYPIYPDEAPWIVDTTAGVPETDTEFEAEGDEGSNQDEEEQDEEGPGEQENGWTADDLGPLVTVLRSERDPRLRLRAARALGELGATNIHAVEALAATALWGEGPSIRAAALQALVKIYGDEETELILGTFKEMHSLQPDQQAALDADEDEEEIEGEPEKDTFAQRLPPPIPYTQHEPVIRDEGPGRLRQVLWIGIILLVILGLVVVFTYFK